MIRIRLQRFSDGRIIVKLTVGHVTILEQMIHLTDSMPVTLEVPDE